MKRFAAGFLFAYAAGALPFGLLLARMNEPAVVVVYGAATWPQQLMRVALVAKVEDRR
jgi:hypothetical protein